MAKDSLTKILERRKQELADSINRDGSTMLQNAAIIARLDKLIDAEESRKINKVKLSNERKKYELDVQRLALEQLKVQVEQERIEIDKKVNTRKLDFEELKLKFEKEKFIKELDERSKERKWNFLVKLIEIGAKVGIAVFCTYRLGMKILKAEYADNIIAPKGAVNAQSLLSKF